MLIALWLGFACIVVGIAGIASQLAGLMPVSFIVAFFLTGAILWGGILAARIFA